MKIGAITCALLSGSTALAVLAIWISRADGIAAWWPPLLDIKVNAAVGYVACATALLLFVHGRPRGAMIFALLPLLYGALTLWEHATGQNLGIDQVLLTDWTGAGAPGRAAPNAAAAQSLFGTIFLALGLMRGGGRQDLVVKLLCFAIIAIAAEALAGHIVGSRYAIGWGTPQSMSSLGATCAILLAVGTFAHCMRAEILLFNQASLWGPALLAFGIALLDLSTSLDYQVQYCYLLLTAFGIWYPRRYFLTIFSVLSIALVVFGFFASPVGSDAPSTALVNRGLAIGAILLVAVLVRQHLRSEEARRRMVDHLATIQHLTDTGSFELDLATMTFTSTRGFDRVHGLRTRERRAWGRFVEAMIPADDHATMADFIAAARRGECARTLDYAFLRPDGETGVAMLRCVPTLDERGVPIRITGIVHDVTQQRRREQAREELEAKLRHAQKLESLGMLAGGVAHDLNNMLVPVTMLTPLLLDSIENEDHRQSLQLILGSARRAKELVREMLVFTRKDAPSHELVRLDELVRDSLTILRAGISADIAIREELEPVPAICGSRGQFYQIVLNLAINAAQAIGSRAGTITIGTRSDADSGAPGRAVRLFVRDDGEGMDPGTLDRAFEPFFSTKDGMQGTGIGLSIVYRIVKNHGGAITVQSSRGEGARFDLVFPVASIGEPLCLAA